MTIHQNDLKIKLVTFEDGLVCVGFRRISSFIKEHFRNVETYIYNVSGIGVHFRNFLSSKSANHVEINGDFIHEMLNADVIGFSGMSKFSEYIIHAISQIRKKNKNIFIVWGGVHATVFPEHAIKYADAVCIGEGEIAFLSLLNRFQSNLPIEDTPNFWIKKDNRVIKNNPLPLMTSAQLAEMPFQDYSYEIYQATHSGTVRLDRKHYFLQQGTKYTTLWSLGCPFKCNYCSNSKFILNNSGNARIRYPHPEYIIQELLSVLGKHVYIRFIEFEDDSFMLIKHEDIKLFSELYSKYIKLPFFVTGIHPLTFDQDKINLLVKAGLKKVRMGIQSGSERILSFYNRISSKETILKATDYLSSLYPRIAPPFYDIILDNPIEKEEDKMDTINLLYEMKRPFFIYLYSLRTIPGTALNEFAQKNPQYKFESIEKSYQNLIDIRYGFLAYFLTLCRPPKLIFNVIIKLSRHKFFNRIALFLTKISYVGYRGFWEIRISNFQPVAMLSQPLALILYWLLSVKKWNKPRREVLP